MSNGYIDLPVFGSTGSGGGGGSGTVTSVDLAVPTGFTVSGNPVTTSGTITIGLSSENQSTFWAASSTTSSVPSFRKITTADISGLPSGTVTSVGVNLPSIFSTSGSPVTTAGTIGAILINEPANTVFAAPSASTGIPTFRALVGLDVPAANLATTGNGGVTGTLPGPNITPINLASNANGGVTGTLAVANGGTASSTGFLAGAALLGNGTNPYQTIAPGSSGTFIGSDGSTWAPRTIPNQVFTQVAANLATTGNGGVTGTLPVVNGGTSLSTLTSASLIVGAGTSAPTFLAPGTSGNVAISNGAVWQSSTVPVPTRFTANLATTGAGGVTGVLPVANGGTSLATLTANNVILGNGTSSPLFVAPGTTGNILTSNGLTWLSAAPSSGNYVSNQLVTRVTTTPANVGEYRTYVKTIADVTGTDDAPGTGPSNANGMRIFAVNFASAGTAGQTNRWEAFVGRNKQVQFQYYTNAARNASVSTDITYLGSTVLFGLYTGYDPSSGTVFVDTIQQAGTVTTRLVGEGFQPGGQNLMDLADCYWDVLIK